MYHPLKSTLVQLPSGKVCGGELNANGNVTPHQWGCQCTRCEPAVAKFEGYDAEGLARYSNVVLG